MIRKLACWIHNDSPDWLWDVLPWKLRDWAGTIWVMETFHDTQAS